jgi:hypothetical protein
VHGTVLLLAIVEMLGVSVDRVISEYSLHQQEPVEIRVFPAWCIIEDTDRRVDHFVISDEEQSRVIDRFF